MDSPHNSAFQSLLFLLPFSRLKASLQIIFCSRLNCHGTHRRSFKNIWTVRARGFDSKIGPRLKQTEPNGVKTQMKLRWTAFLAVFILPTVAVSGPINVVNRHKLPLQFGLQVWSNPSKTNILQFEASVALNCVLNFGSLIFIFIVSKQIVYV